jgi:WD40 repeat protein
MLDIFNLPDLTRWHSIGTGNFHFCSAFSPNGQYLYIGNAQWPMRFRMSDKNLVYFGEAAADTLRTLDVSPSGQVIVVGGWTAPRVERYDAASLLKLPNFNDLPTGQVRWVRYSPNGAYVGVCFNDQPGFALYDAVTRNRLHLGSGQVDSGLVCEFSPDSSKVAVISASNNANNRLIIVDINTWVGTYPSPNLGTVDAKLRFSSDGTKLYVAEGGYTGKVYVYNMSDLSRTEIILSPSWASVNSLCLSI